MCLHKASTILGSSLKKSLKELLKVFLPRADLVLYVLFINSRLTSIHRI